MLCRRSTTWPLHQENGENSITGCSTAMGVDSGRIGRINRSPSLIVLALPQPAVRIADQQQKCRWIERDGRNAPRKSMRATPALIASLCKSVSSSSGFLFLLLCSGMSVFPKSSRLISSRRILRSFPIRALFSRSPLPATSALFRTVQLVAKTVRVT